MQISQKTKLVRAEKTVAQKSKGALLAHDGKQSCGEKS
jgi:hypothetical protein